METKFSQLRSATVASVVYSLQRCNTCSEFTSSPVSELVKIKTKRRLCVYYAAHVACASFCMYQLLLALSATLRAFVACVLFFRTNSWLNFCN